MSEENSVWIKTTPTLDGAGYVVTLEADQDTARTLTPDDAATYAIGVLAAVSRAEYDAAVIRQLTTKLGTTINRAAELVSQLRADRPPLDPADTAPLGLVGGVNKDVEPFLVISVAGERVGQWDMAAARGHAFAVFEAITVADLDSGYYQMLKGAIGIEAAQARQVVDDLGNYRQNTIGGEPS